MNRSQNGQVVLEKYAYKSFRTTIISNRRLRVEKEDKEGRLGAHIRRSHLFCLEATLTRDDSVPRTIDAAQCRTEAIRFPGFR